ncbi:hypothetical protein BO70DRAFT_362158, partial [Aspergillus heteromorphus CBS 117.55]
MLLLSAPTGQCPRTRRFLINPPLIALLNLRAFASPQPGLLPGRQTDKDHRSILVSPSMHACMLAADGALCWSHRSRLSLSARTKGLD